MTFTVTVSIFWVGLVATLVGLMMVTSQTEYSETPPVAFLGAALYALAKSLLLLWIAQALDLPLHYGHCFVLTFFFASGLSCNRKWRRK